WNDTAPAWIDCDAFQQQLGDLRDDTLASMAVEQALDLYQGDFLEEVGDAPWVLADRDRLRDLFLRGIELVARQRLVQGEYAAVRDLARRGLAVAALYEPLHALLIRAAFASGDSSGALQQYERYRRALDAELGALPSPGLRALHTAMLRGDAQPPSLRRAPQPAAARTTPLVGRDAEVALFEQQIGLMQHRNGTTLALVGEAGIGKTRLASEAVRLAAIRGAQVIELRCAPLDRGLPLAPVSEALRPLLRAAPVAHLRRLPKKKKKKKKKKTTTNQKPPPPPPQPP
ncbi:MAG TPA: BTAD domain-containing putative transcriptional regulator, partial [Roseiflexaceae bacterium]|nr:BTAD domain-containing putative transcriptional regulator [Roseiflexaceae bacterium]